MSYKNYEEALEKARLFDDYLDAGSMDIQLLEKIESAIGFKLSKQNYNYWKNYGFIAFSSVMLYGIGKNTFNGVPGYNAINTLLVDRKDFNLPKSWIPIYGFGDENMAYLNYEDLNKENEPAIISAYYNGHEYVVTEKISDDLGDFILTLVNEQKTNQ
jgi:hypothetical protein